MKSVSITDIGETRTMNQDFMYCCEHTIGKLPNLFIVADGMGGHNAGDYASKCAVNTLKDYIEKSSLKTTIGILDEAIQKANQVILEEAKKDNSLRGMGTTLVAAVIYEHEMYVMNIGDSRLYLIGDKIKQITEDHSYVEEMVRSGELSKEQARIHPNKNMITRALGGNRNLKADYFEVDIKKGDIVLLCSDGLSNMIEDQEILEIIKNERAHGIKEIGRQLVLKANKYGGKDNITLILIEI